jgi:transcriptional regulator with XRE-family HTH domain
MARTKNFADVIRAKLAADSDLANQVESEAFNTDIAMKVYQARTEAGLTQRQLAARIGTQQSVISRIEDANYEGHSLGILKRIASALGQNLRVEFYAQSTPLGRPPATATTVARLENRYVLKEVWVSNSSAVIPSGLMVAH